ncbi:MAG: methyltransferase domain-containing protein [Eubacterium sp.]
MGKGGEFILSFGYPIADNETDFRKAMEERLGKDEAAEVVRLLNDRADQKQQDAINHADFYRMKNENLPRSLAISIGFEGDLLIRTCDWIEAHPQYFGRTVLDQGCDIGLLSLFMAKNFPDKEITGIDICSEAVMTASQLKDRHGLENLHFYTVKDWSGKTAGKNPAGNAGLAGSGQYETVFSSRTLQENLDSRRISGLAFSPFVEKVRKKEKLFVPYARILRERCADKGKLISIERLAQPSARTAYLQALKKAGFSAAEEIGELDARDLDQHEQLGIFCAENAEDKAEKIDQEKAGKLAERYLASVSRELPEYKGEEADLILAAEDAELLEGAYLFQKRRVIGKMALYHSRTDAESLWYYQGVWAGERGIARYPLQMKRAAQENLRMQLQSIQKSGYTVRPFIQKKDGREIVIRDPRR